MTTCRPGHSGTGPGPITPDGCAVELYSILPPGDEPMIIQRAVPSGAYLLELGAGAGRLTVPLVRAGYRVVAVDESAEMLARIESAETVLSRIEDLDLGERFDAVVLASFLVNVADDGVRHELLQTCRRHVLDDGLVLIQRHPPAWFDSADESDHERGGVQVRLRDVTRPTPDTLSATTEYRAGGSAWTQSFVTRRLTDPELTAELQAAGLELQRFIDDRNAWATATRGVGTF